jgi:septation ring formation regulator EzrA
MALVKEAWDILWKWLRGRNVADQKLWDEIYQSRIKFLNEEKEQSDKRIKALSEELEERTREIEKLKKKHPGNDKDYKVWQDQLDQLYIRLYNCEKEKMEMRGKLIFYDELVKHFEKNKK